MYRFAAVVGGKVLSVPWTDTFPTDEVIDALDDGVSLVAMISPNNPTGRTADASDLERIAEKVVPALLAKYVDRVSRSLIGI